MNREGEGDKIVVGEGKESGLTQSLQNAVEKEGRKEERMQEEEGIGSEG